MADLDGDLDSEEEDLGGDLDGDVPDLGGNLHGEVADLGGEPRLRTNSRETSGWCARPRVRNRKNN